MPEPPLAPSAFDVFHGDTEGGQSFGQPIAIRNHTFRHPHMAQEVKLAMDRLLAANFVKECPFCSELVKSQAKVCKHCQRDLPA